MCARSYPLLTAELHKTLKPYSSSLERVVALTKQATSKKAIKSVYNLDWVLSLNPGDAFGAANVSKVSKTSQKSTFIVNLQPYFGNFDVRFTEGARARAARRARAVLAGALTPAVALQSSTPTRSQTQFRTCSSTSTQV